MSVLMIPEGYRPKLGLYDTQSAIEVIKQTFVSKLTANLNLRRVTAPLFVQSNTGLNDNLNGTERAVAFDIPDADTEARWYIPWPNGSAWLWGNTVFPRARACTRT